MAASSHFTVQGETWDQIAKARLGSEKRVSLLMAANPAHRAVLFFPAGVRLAVPDVPPVREEVVAPWKR